MGGHCLPYLASKESNKESNIVADTVPDGPGSVNMDLSVLKDFAVWESHRLQLLMAASDGWILPRERKIRRPEGDGRRGVPGMQWEDGVYWFWIPLPIQVLR